MTKYVRKMTKQKIFRCEKLSSVELPISEFSKHEHNTVIPMQ